MVVEGSFAKQFLIHGVPAALPRSHRFLLNGQARPRYCLTRAAADSVLKKTRVAPVSLRCRRAIPVQASDPVATEGTTATAQTLGRRGLRRLAAQPRSRSQARHATPIRRSTFRLMSPGGPARHVRPVKQKKQKSLKPAELGFASRIPRTCICLGRPPGFPSGRDLFLWPRSLAESAAFAR